VSGDFWPEPVGALEREHMACRTELIWRSNMAGYRKRSTAIGINQTIGNIGGV
jgi:hypothetical protein